MTLTHTPQNEYPLVSIITAVYNGYPYIKDLIESVLQQDYPNFEHIIIDDGSDDNGATVQVLEQYPHLQWWSRENKGQYATQNEGLAAAKGDILNVISADDVYTSSKTLSTIVTAWLAHPDIDILYGKTLYMNAAGDLLSYQLDMTNKYPQWLIKHYLYIQHCSLFVSKNMVFARNIWFDPSYKFTGDWDWIIRLIQKSEEIVFVPDPLATIRKHELQTSHIANHDAQIKEHKSISRKYSSNYLIQTLIRHVLQYRAFLIILMDDYKKRGMPSTISLIQNRLRKKILIKPYNGNHRI